MKISSIKIHISFLWGICLLLLSPSIWALPYSHCDEMPIAEAMSHADKMTGLMRIANYRADLETLEILVHGDTESAEGNDDENILVEIGLKEFIDSCSPNIYPIVCGYACHVELARYYLIRSGDIAYLSESEVGAETFSPANLNYYAGEGIDRIDRALKNINHFVESPDADSSTESEGSAEANVSSDTDDSSDGLDTDGDEPPKKKTSYDDYLEKKSRLVLLRTKMQINIGDNWYRSVSGGQFYHLASVIGASIDDTSTGLAGQYSNANYSQAWEAYKDAKWSILEGKSDTVGTRLATDFKVIEKDLENRLESISKGHLFLNIDPRQIPRLTYDQILFKLTQVSAEIKESQGKIHSIVESWLRDDVSQEMILVDERRYVNSKNMDMMAQNIALLEGEGSRVREEFGNKLTTLENTIGQFGYQRQIDQLYFDLAQKKAELEYQKRSIGLNREIEQVAVKADAIARKRDDVRWQIGQSISTNNIQMQQLSLSKQVEEYNHNIERNGLQDDLLGNQWNQLVSMEKIEKEKIAEANATKKKLTKLQTDMYQAQRISLINQICYIQDQLYSLGETEIMSFRLEPGEQGCGDRSTDSAMTSTVTKEDYLELVCGDGGEGGLRQRMMGQEAMAEAFVLKCIFGEELPYEILEIVGNDSTLCADMEANGFVDTNDIQLMIDIFEQELSSVRRQRDNTSAAMGYLNDYMNQYKNDVKDLITSNAVQYGLLQGVSDVLMTLAIVPEISTGMLLGMPGSEQTFDFYKMAQALHTVTSDIYSYNVNIGRTVFEKKQRLETLSMEVDRLRDQLAVSNIEVVRTQVAQQRSLFKILGEVSQVKSNLLPYITKNQISIAECKEEDRTFDMQKLSLVAEQTRLMDELSRLQISNDLIDYDMDSQDRIINSANYQLDILASKKDEISKQRVFIDDENDFIRDVLIGSLNTQNDMLAELLTEIQELAEESRNYTKAYEELLKMKDEKRSILNDEELAYLQNVFNSEYDFYTEEIESLQSRIQLLVEKEELQNAMSGILTGIYDQIETGREAIARMVATEVENGDEKTNVFVASQETLSTLLKGLPEYLSDKKRSLVRANRALQFLRGRYSVLKTLTGGNLLDSFSDDFVYVTDATSLDKAIQLMEDDRFFSDDKVVIDTVVFTIEEDTAFMQSIMQNGYVTFRIDPSVKTKQDMQEKGFLTLWNNKFEQNENVRVIDVIVAGTYDRNAERNNNVMIRHHGDGVCYRRLTPTSEERVQYLDTMPSRYAVKEIYDIGKPRFESKTNQVENGEISFFNFPPTDMPARDRELPLLGLPVAGTWDISLMPSDTFAGAEEERPTQIAIVFKIAVGN